MQNTISTLPEALNEIIRIKGYEILENRSSCLGLFKDIAPNLKKERMQIEIVMISGTWEKIIKLKSQPDNEKLRILGKCKNTLLSLGLENSAVEELILSICDGIGIGCSLSANTTQPDKELVTPIPHSPVPSQQKIQIQSTNYIQGNDSDYELKTIGSNGELEIVKFIGFETDSMEVPGIINGKKVISIGDEAFLGCSNVKKIIVSEGIQLIGSSSFKDCNSLEEINLPKSLIRMKNNAFSCSALKSINLPEKIKNIPHMTFSNCRNLKTVILGSNIKVIESCAFYYCNALETINFPSTIKEIRSRAFEHCENLQAIEIGERLLEIGDLVFVGCKRLKEIKLKEGLLKIGDQAFQNCSSIEKIFLPNSVQKIGKDLFRDVSNRNLTMYCYAGSLALQYAREHNIKYADASKI